MPAKYKTVEITVRVRVPPTMSVRRAKEIVSNHWYGEIYTDGNNVDGCEELHPRWCKARKVGRTDTPP